MRLRKTPPDLTKLIQEHSASLSTIMVSSVSYSVPGHPYPHWDKLRFLPPPEGLTGEQWWLGLRLSRGLSQKPIPLVDAEDRPFVFSVPEPVLQEIHQIDLGAGGLIAVPEPITNPHTRNRYIVNSLIEEAITSSQLEGAATTREVAKRMIADGRKPRDVDERMIYNNYLTIQLIRKLRNETLTPDLVLEIHRNVTDQTLDDPTACGRFRKPTERVVVGDDFGEVFHTPPPAEQLPERMRLMCAFAAGEEGGFVHPVIRAILLHFWLAYDHPFVDGNGRTARALFYWLMLKSGYWLFEYISISTILRKAPAKYGRSFLYTETDGNDVTYFLLAQTQVIRKAIAALHAYIDRKTAELTRAQAHTHALSMFNHRQAALITDALKYPGKRFTIKAHQTLNKVVYQTARTDLLGLVKYGVLNKTGVGKQLVFVAPDNLPEHLMSLSDSKCTT